MKRIAHQSVVPAEAELAEPGIAAPVASLFENWATVRRELLGTRICDLGLRIPGSPLEPLVQKLYRELAAKGLRFRPTCYLTDSWGCPNEIPVIGIPFYLADRRLIRLEEEQTGEVENETMTMMLLRHEAGHAFNYAYRLWEAPGWAAAFGRFSKPYRDSFQPQTYSRRFVRHLFSRGYGRTYAQKHPDEDFSETFAVWLTPRSCWRRKYDGWPAISKIEYVDSLLRSVGQLRPRRDGGRLYNPVEKTTMLLVNHYGEKLDRFHAAAWGFVDDRLREVFPQPATAPQVPARDLLRRHRRDLLVQMMRWSGLDAGEARRILAKLETRAEAIQVGYRRDQEPEKLLDVGAMATALAMEFAYTGRFVG